MVAEDGRNRYPYDMVWLTDGYGDYVRHYLRAMAAAPELAPTISEPSAANKFGRQDRILLAGGDCLFDFRQGFARTAARGFYADGHRRGR